MSKINIFYSKKKLQGTRCHKSVIFLEWCMTHCPIKLVCPTPKLFLSDRQGTPLPYLGPVPL